MYVLIAGVVDRIERNEAILFGRDGKEVGRFLKMAKTHPEQVPGDAAPVFETDFGRVACRICADEWAVELDRCYALKGADILLTPTQSWGPDALFRDLRDISRAMDGGMFVVECTHPSTEVRHRSMIIEPTGVVVARSEYRQDSVLSAGGNRVVPGAGLRTRSLARPCTEHDVTHHHRAARKLLQGRWLASAGMPVRTVGVRLQAHRVYVVSANGTTKPSAQVRVFRFGQAASVRAFSGADAGDAPACSS
jgi:hypothetical protein